MRTTFEIRKWQHGDEGSLAKHANNVNIWNNVRDYFPHPYTLSDATEWVTIAKDDANNFAITVNGEAVGAIALFVQKDVYRKNAELGYWLGEDYWKRGIMTEAVKQIVEHGFQNLEINRIYAGTFEFNTASGKVLSKAGFRHEATLKNAIYKNGQFCDELVYSILREGK